MMRVVMLLLTTLALTRGQEFHCHCEAWATVLDTMVPVLELPPIDIPECDQLVGCDIMCEEEWTSQTDSGNLDFVTSDGTVLGQSFCTTLAAAGYDQYDPSQGGVYMYANLCHGPWLFVGGTTQQPLCCDGGTYVTCTPLTSVSPSV